MTTVTLKDVSKDTPSTQLLAKAMQEFKATDSAGRIFTIRRPAFLQQFRIVEAAGELAQNDRYMNMVAPLIYIIAIDGDPISQPINKLQLEALIQRVDEHGFEAVVDCLAEHFPKRDPETDKAALKK